MVKKLSLFVATLMSAVSLSAQSDLDVSLKYGLTSLDNDDGWELENHTLAADATFDLGYALKPRVDVAYVNVKDDEKWGGISSLLQAALGAQIEERFNMAGFAHTFYLYGGLGYEYVADGHETFDSLPFFQAGLGVKYAVSDKVNLVGEFKAMQVFDSNNDSDDEDNEFAFLVGLNFPIGGQANVIRPADADRDGVADKIDLCPNTQRGAKVDLSGCELDKKVVVLDSDNDGVSDDMDQCPNTKLDKNMRVSATGCPIQILLDSDGDGVTDDIDTCKNTPLGAKVDDFGCAKAINLQINFESNQAVLKADSVDKVKAFANYLKAAPAGTVAIIEGHTDSSGNAEKNRALSSKRAFAVRKALIAEGVKKNMVRAYGKGSAEPIADNESVEGRAKNRRIEAIIEYKGER